MARAFILIVLFLLNAEWVIAQEQTIAREWIEELLEAVRSDFARPTVHARNLWHHSILMYDLWAVYEESAETYFLGKEIDGFDCPFEGIPASSDIDGDRHKAMSYAMYRLIAHRFANSPKSTKTLVSIIERMQSYGYLISNSSMDYQTGDAAALGNYIASQMILFGLQDGSNEANDYENTYYKPVNPVMSPEIPGDNGIINSNHWQPLSFQVFIDQSGNPRPGGAPDFLSPEWGVVVPFALDESDKKVLTKNGQEYIVWHDPESPPLIESGDEQAYLPQEYQWGHTLVAIWSSHLDQKDGIIWDISPGSKGNNLSYPLSFSNYDSFYNTLEGGDPSQGRPINPKTGNPYEPNLVPRGDYARVLAEFWADGPDSETPPGHWYTITNYVNDHPKLIKKFEGQGEEVDPLEWDVKIYFTLGGAVHDAAVSSWSIKGYYDYIRPISAIRYMADQGQSTNQSLANYHPNGIPLYDGFVEVVNEGDSLAGSENQHVGKIKLFAWRGPAYIDDPEVDQAGVGWILAENWWPYQRPTFITPPFAGYISGHSTFSRAAAQVLSLFTGDEYFPGGLGEFVAKKDSFLVFEEGPSVDVVLQWATYKDASDETSLSRIWGGIHPPCDDIPGRLIGEIIGTDAFNKAKEIFNTGITPVTEEEKDYLIDVFPTTVAAGELIKINLGTQKFDGMIQIIDPSGRLCDKRSFDAENGLMTLSSAGWPKGVLFLVVRSSDQTYSRKIIVK